MAKTIWTKRAGWTSTSFGYGRFGYQYSRKSKMYYVAQLPYVGNPQVISQHDNRKDAIAATIAAAR